MKSFSLATGPGDSVGVLEFSANRRSKTVPTLTLRLLAMDGSVIAQVSGPSVQQLPVVLRREPT